MFHFISKKIMRWLSILLFTGALFTIGMVAFPAFYYSRESLEESSFKWLSAVNKIKKKEMLCYIKEKMEDLKIHAGSWDVIKATELLQAYHNKGTGNVERAFDISTNEYKEIYDQIDPFFRKYIEVYGYYDIFLLCSPHGHVMYSATKNADLGTSLKTGLFKDSGMAKLWEKTVKEKKPVMTDFTLYTANNKTSFFLGTPVFLQNKNEIAAILGLQMTVAEVNAIIQESIGMGETEETYLAGEDLLMRSDSRFDSDSNVLKKKIRAVAFQKGLNRENSVEITENYKGVKVLSAYSRMGLKEELSTDFDWIIISEISEREAFASVNSLRWKIMGIGIFLLIFSGIVGYFIARYIGSPLQKLSDKAVSMANGDLTVTIAHGNRADEIGTLMNAFYYMLNTLRNETQQVIEGTNTLASSISQISATATQLATSSAETSTSITEITSTVEDVRQTVNLSNEKAELVAESSEKGIHISETGKKATDDAISGMNRIKEEMEYVAESIVKLSEQTQSIGEIISAVNDLADQSNLLSVNASIEAAKAGEHGKGFAVVAQEVKSLADQSKEATNQVRTILNDIQKATSAAVMATERGSKAVEKGVDLAIRLGDAINDLSNSVVNSAKAAMQIAASSQEQLVGMDQLLHAMENIKEASIQNVDGAKQLESATRNLDDLAKQLKEMASMFRI